LSRVAAQAFLTHSFGPFGEIKFPYYTMGKIDSLHLFGEPELMIFALYCHNRERWSRVLDIGANLGLHSILMSKLGWEVKAYEPDFDHFQKLLSNLENNNCKTVTPCMAAVHTKDGEARFVRVLNNLTGSHLEGFKDSYGPKETLIVPTVDCSPLFDWADFAKIDCEGNESELLETTTPMQMRHLSCIVEVRDEHSAQRIYEHFRDIAVPMWAQRIDWKPVETFADMPRHNREGSLFIGHRGPWD
jgi:FkbM family methyltransferase